MGQPVDNNQAGLYNSMGLSNSYEFHPGVCILPLAEDPPTNPTELSSYSPVVVARLHAPYRVRKVTYVGDKKNNPPPLPTPSDTGSFVFIGGGIKVTNSLNTTFRNFDWTGVCSYGFVENCVSRPEDGLVLGIPAVNWTSSTLNISEGYVIPPVGAASHAGLDVAVGYAQSLKIIGDSQTGSLKYSWGYNTPSYYPGNLFYDNMLNGGTPLVPPPSQG